MPKIAVLGGSGYLSSLIKNQNKKKINKFIFFSRKGSLKNKINYLAIKKNIKNFKNFDILLHLAGPNHHQLNKNPSLLKKKILITSKICDVCLANNIKLLYLSSMQVYKDYGKNNISLKSKINYKNYYSRSHYESEKIIFKKFRNNRHMFTILRMGNVFGFKKFNNFKEINNNLIHDLSILALKNRNICIQNGSIQRTFIPSGIFVNIVNLIINKNYFKNTILNISYKNLTLYEVAKLIQKRLIFIFNYKIDIIFKKFEKRKKFSISSNLNFTYKPVNKRIFEEIDHILKCIKKKI